MIDEMIEKDAKISQKEEISYEKALDKGRKKLEQFKQAYTAVGTRPDELREAIAFMEGDQYKLATYSDTTPWVVQMKTPHAKNMIETRVASISANDYVGELFPLNIEDIETVSMLNDLLRDEWGRLNLNEKIDDAIRDSAFLREGYIHFVFDEKETHGGTRDGVIYAYPIDSTNVFIDPNARQWNDAQYIAVVGRLPKRVAKIRYGSIVDLIKPKQAGLSESERGEVSIANDYNIEQDNYFSFITFYEKYNGKIKKCVVVEDVYVSEVILDGINVFPIAQVRWTKRKQNCYGISLMDDLITSQKAINSIESAVTNIAVSSASPAVVIQRGQGLNPKDVAETLGAPQVVYAVNGDPAKAIVPLNLNAINPAILQIKQEHEQALARAAGVTDQFLGSLGTVGNTSGGAKLAIERAKVQEGAILKNIQEFVEQITTIMVQYVSSQYRGTTVKSMTRDNLTRNFNVKEYNVPENIKDINYKFYIDLHIRTPFSKELEKQAMMELWQMERQYDSPIKILTVLDVLGKYDLTNSEELVQRYKDASAQSSTDKAQVVIEMTTAAQKYQIDQQLLQAAVTEVMSGAKETPATDQLMQMVDQAAQQEQMMQQQAAQQQQTMQTEVAQTTANQIVDQMAPEEVMNMAQKTSMPAQIEQMMAQGQ